MKLKCVKNDRELIGRSQACRSTSVHEAINGSLDGLRQNYQMIMNATSEDHRSLSIAEDHEILYIIRQNGLIADISATAPDTEEEASFNHLGTRNLFLRKLFGMVFLETALATAIITCFLINPVEKYLAANKAIWLAATVVFASVWLLLSCIPVIYKDKKFLSFPWNLLVSTLLYVSMATFLAVLSAITDSETFLFSAISVEVNLVILFITTFISCIHFTSWHMFIYVLFGSVFSICAGAPLAFYFIEISISIFIRLVSSFLIALATSMLLLYDLQNIIKGKYKHDIQPKDHFTALQSLSSWDFYYLYLRCCQATSDELSSESFQASTSPL